MSGLLEKDFGVGFVVLNVLNVLNVLKPKYPQAETFSCRSPILTRLDPVATGLILPVMNQAGKVSSGHLQLALSIPSILWVLFFFLWGAPGLVGQGNTDRGPGSGPDSAIYAVNYPFSLKLKGGRYYAPSERWSEEIRRAIDQAADLADSILGPREMAEFRLYLVESDQEFHKLIGGSFPDWGAAAASPSRNLIALKAPNLTTADKPLAQLAAHEYAHLAVAAAVSPGHPPRWLDEGLAMYFSSEWSYQDFITVSLASLRGGFIPLAAIDTLNAMDGAAARLAYTESYLAVDYIIGYYGGETLRSLLQALSEGNSIDRSLQGTIGTDLAGFESELFTNIRQRRAAPGILMESTVFWGALSLLVIVGFVRARLRRKKRYQQWEEEERLHSTDFDYGDPDNPEKIEDEDRPWE